MLLPLLARRPPIQRLIPTEMSCATVGIEQIETRENKKDNEICKLVCSLFTPASFLTHFMHGPLPVPALVQAA